MQKLLSANYVHPDPFRMAKGEVDKTSGMGFNKLTDIMRQVGERYPSLSKRLKEAQALSRWEVAVGPAISKHTRAIRVQDGTLWVEVDHPIWKSELHHRKRQILEILNSSNSSPNPSPEVLQEIKDLLLLDPRNYGA